MNLRSRCVLLPPLILPCKLPRFISLFFFRSRYIDRCPRNRAAADRNHLCLRIRLLSGTYDGGEGGWMLVSGEKGRYPPKNVFCSARRPGCVGIFNSDNFLPTSDIKFGEFLRNSDKILTATFGQNLATFQQNLAR